MGSNEMLDGFGGAREALEQKALDKAVESEAAALETGLEGLTREQQQIMQSFDERIETEFRRLDMIDHMEKNVKSWSDGVNHSLEVEKVRMLISEIAECGVQHADDPVFSAMLVEKADQVSARLNNHCEKRAQDLLDRLDHFENDLISRHY